MSITDKSFDTGSDSEDTIVFSDDSTSSALVRICQTCGTFRTPLWRSGPAGPKSLCNACGIKLRKKAMALGLNKNSIEQNAVAKKGSGRGKRAAGESSGEGGAKGKKDRSKLSEVERAALLLMCLSRGSWDD